MLLTGGTLSCGGDGGIIEFGDGESGIIGFAGNNAEKF
jgi:hypothetical protein